MIKNYETSGLDPGYFNKHKRPLKAIAFEDKSSNSRKAWMQNYHNIDLNSGLKI